MGPPGLGPRCRVGRHKIHRLAVTDLTDRHTRKDNDCRRRPSTEAAMAINNDTHQENRRIWRPLSRWRGAGGVNLSIPVGDVGSGVHNRQKLLAAALTLPALVDLGLWLVSSLSWSTKFSPNFQWYFYFFFFSLSFFLSLSLSLSLSLFISPSIYPIYSTISLYYLFLLSFSTISLCQWFSLVLFQKFDIMVWVVHLLRFR